VSDPIDQAIAAVQAPVTVKLQRFDIQLAGTGRPVILFLPEDLSAHEALCVQRAILEVYDHQQNQRSPSRLVVPGNGLAGT
jgi:hypothetical protein